MKNYLGLRFLPITLGVMRMISLYGISFSLLSCGPENTQEEYVHPIWPYEFFDKSKVPEDKCVFTQAGFKKLRFHVTREQIDLSTPPFQKDDKGIIKVEEEIGGPDEEVGLVLTPHFYGRVSKESFPKTMKAGIKSVWGEKNGLPEVFLDELLALEKKYFKPEDYKEVMVIISQGFNNKLGVSQELKKKLKEKKEKKEIREYEIVALNSVKAMKLHNKWVKEGKKVITFIATRC